MARPELPPSVWMAPARASQSRLEVIDILRGLALFGWLSPAPVALLGLAVYASQLVLSPYWLRHFRFGPIEWCWRSLMHGQRQPMRRTVARVE